MSYRVHIEDDFAMDSYRVFMFEVFNDGRRLMHLGDGSVRWVDNAEAATISPREDFFCRLPKGEAAHALLGALSRQLGAVEHPEQLRRDYEHERGRVDKMLDYLLERPA